MIDNHATRILSTLPAEAAKLALRHKRAFHRGVELFSDDGRA